MINSRVPETWLFNLSRVAVEEGNFNYQDSDINSLSHGLWVVRGPGDFGK